MLRITSFSIEALNNLFDYKDCSIDGPSSDLLILYGDNGSGKTTVLNLIFHLLSPRPNRGHLNAISKVPFRSLRISLSDDTVVSAERMGDVNTPPVIFRIVRPGCSPIEYRFVPEKARDRFLQDILENEFRREKERRQSIAKQSKSRRSQTPSIFFGTSALSDSKYFTGSDEDAHKKYISALNDLGVKFYYMATDRKIRSDLIEVEQSNSRHGIEPRDINEDVIFAARAQYLKEAMTGASRYINRQIIRASNYGSKNTNDIYIDLIKRISQDGTAESDSEIAEQMQSATKRLNVLAEQNKKFSDLGILPALDFDEINSVMAFKVGSNDNVLQKILWPYIESLSARLLALNPIGGAVETFLNLLNQLFKYKSIKFSPADGFTIYGPASDQPLDVENLSSGEQQLLLIFCYLLIASEHQSVFMIDEPELSLNVKWQRDLIDAMQQIANNTKTQIIMATHSIELLAQHSDLVIALDPVISENKKSIYETSKEDN